MIKRIILFTLIGLLLCILSCYSHLMLLQNNMLSYSLQHVYLFHLVTSLSIYWLTECIYAYISKQAGFFYLLSMPLKAVLFLFIFKETIFSAEEMNFAERVGLVVPMLLFLLFEIISVSSVLNKDS